MDYASPNKNQQPLVWIMLVLIKNQLKVVQDR